MFASLSIPGQIFCLKGCLFNLGPGGESKGLLKLQAAIHKKKEKLASH